MRSSTLFLAVLVLLIQICESSSLQVGPLDDWASMITNAESGSEIHFLAGNYHGDCDVQISKAVTLIGEAGPTHTIIDCRGSARHFNVRMNATLQVDGLTFMNGNSTGADPQDAGGGCIAASANTKLTLRNTILKGCFSPAGGGAIFAAQSALVLDGVTLQDSFAGGSGGCISALASTVSMTDMTISGCMAGLHGGGVSLVGSHLTMQGIHAESNSAGDMGGAVYGGDESSVSVSFSTFHLNRAGEFVGVVQPVGYGGAVAVAHGSMLSIAERVTMSENEADWTGGAVYGHMYCIVSIAGNVSIVRNTAGRRAGAAGVYMSHLNVHGSVLFAENGVGPLHLVGQDWLGGAMTGEMSTGSITGGVRCLRNWAQVGGCIFGWGWYQLEIGNDVKMNENHAAVSGGAMVLFGGGTLKLFDNVEMSYNDVEVGSGGSSYLHGEVGAWLDVQLSGGVKVVGNSANWGGGGIWGRWVSMQTRDSVEVRGNSAESGGAFEMTYETELVLGSGLRVVDNFVLQNGGGLSIHTRGEYLDGRCEVNVSSGVVIEGNIAPWNGAGFALEACKVHMDEVVVRNNRAGDTGGGMCLTRGSNAVLVGVQLESNSASHGGAIQLDFSNAEVRGCQVRNCTASVDGGGMHITGDSTLVLTNTAVKHCQASGQGGGIASTDDSRVVLRSGVSVVGGWAGVRGGGLHFGGARAEFAGDEIWVAENRAGKEGGGISYFSEVLFQSGRTTVASNYAEAGGGMVGIGWRAEARVVGERLVVEGNTAVHNGGGLALLNLARINVQSAACPGSCAAGFNDTYLQDWCFTPECNFDGGDYGQLFLGAGERALGFCDRSPWGCSFDQPNSDSTCIQGCFGAQCGWGDGGKKCNANRARNAACPIWDALALRSFENHEPTPIFVKNGGPAMGAGRCAEPCRPGPAPPVPESCQEPACHGDTSGWKDEPWCNTIDDTWNPHMHSRGWTPEDGFGPWGSCTDRKNLPHSGFEYDRDSLLATLGMSLPRLLQEYPGCGKVPIVFAKNRAGGNGGGLYKSSCSLQPDLKHVCFLSGMSGAVVVSFEENMAGAAGGGAYIACDKLGECDNHVHIPEIGGQSLHFEGNEAGTFGADVGSGPRELLLSKAVREYVPGQSILSLSFELRDALGQTLRSTSDAVLPFLVSFSVCAPEGACDSGSALQAIGYMSLRAGGAEGSTEDSKTILQYCVLGEESVRVRVELLGDESEDAGLTSKEIEVQCLPCDPLQKMVTVELGGRRLWTCQSCDAGEYVLNLGGNDPEAQCHNCPVGAECVDGVVRGRVPSSTWEIDEEKRQIILTSCPPGYQLSNSVDGDRTSPFSHDSQQCRRCGANQYILNYTQPCRECPAGGDCTLLTMSPRVAGSRWEAAQGWLRLAECPPGFTIVRSDVKGMELLDQCVMCPAGKYSRQPAVVTGSSRLVFETIDEARIENMCFDCPTGAECEGSQVTPRKGYWVMEPEDIESRRELANASWEVGVFQCQPLACEGGEENKCSPGREGPVCGLCSAGYTKASPRCVKCTSGLNWIGRAFYIVICCIALVVCYASVLRPILAQRAEGPVLFSASGERQEVATQARGCTRLIEYMKEKRRGTMHLQRYLKVVVGFYQLLSSFLFTFPVNWSQGNVDIMSYASLFTLDFMSLPGIACVTSGLSYPQKLMLHTLAPVLVLVVFVLPGLWFAARGRAGQHATQRGQMGRAAGKEKAVDTVIHISLVWLFIIYPAVTRHSLANFLCQELLGGVNLLTSDYSLACPLDAPSSFLFVYSVCFSVLSVAGIPLVFCLALNAYSVPRLARTKLRDAEVREMIAMFKKQHRHDLNSLLILLRLHIVDDLRTMEHCFLERCAELYQEIADANSGVVDAEGIEHRMTMANTQCVKPQVIVQIVEAYAKGGTDGLTEVEFVEVMRAVLLENTAFNQNESFASLDAGQVQRLLAENWKPQALADSASAPPEPLSELKSRLVVRIERLRLLGLLQPPPVEWNGETEEERKALESVGFLFNGYVVGVWYWDIVELLRKVFFIGLLPFIAEQRNVQLAIGFLLTSAFLLVASRVRPFKEEGVDTVYMWSNAALGLTLFYGHLVDGHWPASFKSTIATLNIAVIFSVLFSPFIVQLFLSSWSPTLLARRCWPCPSQESAEVDGKEPPSSEGRQGSSDGSVVPSTNDKEWIQSTPSTASQGGAVDNFRLLQAVARSGRGVERISTTSPAASASGLQRRQPNQRHTKDPAQAVRTVSEQNIGSRAVIDQPHVTVDTGFVSGGRGFDIGTLQLAPMTRETSTDSGASAVAQETWGGAHRQHEQYVAILARGAAMPEEAMGAADTVVNVQELAQDTGGSGVSFGPGEGFRKEGGAGTGLAEEPAVRTQLGHRDEVSEWFDTQELRNIPLTAGQEVASMSPQVPGLQI